jgi:hypothetical protein
MRSRSTSSGPHVNCLLGKQRGRTGAGALVCLAFLAAPTSRAASAADPPARKPLGIDERNAVLSLIKAVDLAQATDATSAERIGWDGHVLRSGNQTGYVPFRITLEHAENGFKSAVVYVRAVSRHDGIRAADERSIARDWLMRGSSAPPRIPETVYVGQGEMPVGGPAAGSSRQTVSGPAQAFTVLALQQREAERQKAAQDAAKKKTETRQRDPFVFPFEDYYVADVTRTANAHTLERALSLPPGEYDVYVAMIDRGRVKTSGPLIVRRTVVVPDFWNDEIAVSSLILASDVRVLGAAPSARQQSEHPYTFGRAEVVPMASVAYAPGDALTVVYQVCNYGAPDSSLQAEYNFYRVDDGPKRLFNRTPPQQFGDSDLPAPAPWESVAFLTQTVSLQTFPPGRYELEVIVRDRLTRRSATGSIAFMVEPRDSR